MLTYFLWEMENGKKFQKKKENFKCFKCGKLVTGDGYTNHCPNCLWSKHVDINPGDRKSECFGKMEPKKITQKNGEYIIAHSCQKCGFEKNNKTSRDDDFDTVIEISKKSKKLI